MIDEFIAAIVAPEDVDLEHGPGSQLRDEPGEGLGAVQAQGLGGALDPDRLSRTVSSLLFHARKFRSSGGVTIGAREAGTTVELWVEYVGPVLSADRAAEALDLYFPARQGHGNAQAASGLGLGILREVLRRQGGDLLYTVASDGRSRLAMVLPKGGS